MGPEGKAWSKRKDWENGHDGIEKKDASNELMTWGFANGVFDHEAAQPQSFFSSQIPPAPFLGPISDCLSCNQHRTG